MTSFETTVVTSYAAPQIPAALPDFPGSEINLLPLSALDKDLVVQIPLFEIPPSIPPGREIDMELLLGAVPVATYSFITPPDPALFPFDAVLDKRYLLAEGVFEVSSRVVYNGNPYPSSESTRFTINKTPPNYGNPGTPPVLPKEVQENGITSEYLQTHNDEVEMLVPQYLNQKPGDMIECYFGSAFDPSFSLTFVHSSENDTLVKLPGSVVRERGNGSKVVYYRLKSRAGSIGQRSDVTQVDVALTR